MERRTLLKMLLNGMALPLVSTSVASAAIKSNRKLVLVELSGANDGLNTIVPIHDHRYRELRPNIGIDKSEVFDVGNELSLNSAMSDLDHVYQDGELAIVQGLGYPSANRSHFKSIAIWETGSDGIRGRRTGWLTQDLEEKHHLDTVDAHGISLDGDMGIFESPSGVWLSLESTEGLRVPTSHNKVKTTTANPSLTKLLDSAHTLNSSMKRISDKLASKGQAKFRIRGGELGSQLRRTASLIHSGIDTPVIKVKIGGFDTHEDQQWKHRNLLRNLARALSDFSKAMKKMGYWNDLLLLTYSEFGRRTIENDSGGTDHGTAAPHFILGGAVKGGIWGKHPNLGDLIEGDMQFSMDYRSVYERVLTDWFGIQGNNFTSFRNPDLDGIISL